LVCTRKAVLARPAIVVVGAPVATGPPLSGAALQAPTAKASKASKKDRMRMAA
jgi:hypothetical protein